jgi:GTP-binding protein
MPLPVVAIVGRPNVGKSTLFNRFVGEKRAVVHDRPGVTRDRLYEETELVDRQILLIDTGGIEPAPETPLLEAMRRQAMVAVEEADVIIFVVDGRLGLTPADDEVADILRRSGKAVVLAVNKVDGHTLDDLANEFWSLGVQPMHTVSAAHGRGIYELLDEVEKQLPPLPEGADGDQDEEHEDGTIRIAVVGRPNIGKSTLINFLTGTERHLVHDMPGTTMDPVDSPLVVGDRRYVLVDTAGVRKKRKIDDYLERFVSLRAIRSIERCHVTLLVIDGTEGPTEQDARLAKLAASRGRALVVLINKWDLVKDMEQVDSRSTEWALEDRLPHALWAPHLFISALTGKGCHRILPMVDDAYVQFDKRITTSKLNRWLEIALESHTPPQRYHRPVRIYYCTQNRVRPPTFTFFSNTPEGIAAPYRRYLANQLRAAFGFEGSPLRLHFRERRKLGEASG